MTTGRGAWPASGRGGTLRTDGRTPGPYYLLADNDSDQIGLETWCRRTRGLPVQQDDLAVFHGVVAIQLLVSSFAPGGMLKGDGIFGPGTAIAVRTAQSHFGLIADGVVGRKTMPRLLRSAVVQTARVNSVPPEPVYGILANEGAWDPAAVGTLDANDLGLAQINTVAHPTTTFAEAFCPSYAIRFVATYLAAAMTLVDGNLRDAVVSYNLGYGGTRQWIRAGRPDVWTPPWADRPRQPNEYIDRILGAGAEVGR